MAIRKSTYSNQNKDYEVVEGGVKKLRGQDGEQNMLLSEILKVLKRIDFKLQNMSDINDNDADFYN